jgi:alkaline phosphatase D
VKYVNLDSHGYNVVDVTPERVPVEWWHADTVLAPNRSERRDAVLHVKPGRARLLLGEA